MITQAAYSCKLLDKAGLRGCNPTRTPMEARCKLSKESKEGAVDAKLYRSMIGSLRYLVHTRPDISFAVDFLSRFMEAPVADHDAAVKHLLRYIAGTLTYGCVYRYRDGESLTGFSDSTMPATWTPGRALLACCSSSVEAPSAGNLRSRRSLQLRHARRSTLRRQRRLAKAFGLRVFSAS